MTKYVQTLQEQGSVKAAAKHLGTTRQVILAGVAREIAGGASLVVPEQITRVEQHALKRQVAALKTELKEVSDAALEAERRAEITAGFLEAPLEPPKWLSPPRRKGAKDASIAHAFLSDTHFDEVVRLSQVEGVNSYNRVIAELRLQKFVNSTIRLSKDFISGIEYEGLVLPLGGDMVSGNIHDELAETNEGPILDTCVHWSEQLIAAIEQLLNHFPNILLPCVTGNHGRLHRKPRYKNRVRDNYDWLIYKMVERYFAGNKRVSFLIGDSHDVQYAVYNTRYRLTHGDQFSGGNGIGGISVPIMRGDAKKKKRQVSVGNPYDIVIMGHWHQLIDLGSVIINGSLKGYDEYAYGNNFDFEPAQQAFWLTDPQKGKTIFAPIHVVSKYEAKHVSR